MSPAQRQFCFTRNKVSIAIRVAEESLKLVEMERCRKDINDLRHQVLDSKRFHEFHRATR